MQFYSQTGTRHKGVTWADSRFFSHPHGRPQDRRRYPPAAALVHGVIHNQHRPQPAPPATSTARNQHRPQPAPPRSPAAQKTGMMSSGLMSADTSTPSM